MKYEIVGRRMGDVETLYADPSLALRELNWKAERGLEEMCKYSMPSSLHTLSATFTVVESRVLGILILFHSLINK